MRKLDAFNSEALPKLNKSSELLKQATTHKQHDSNTQVLKRSNSSL
jgi:hypothetical protein